MLVPRAEFDVHNTMNRTKMMLNQYSYYSFSVGLTRKLANII
jgi:hypothetical protein